MIPSSARGFDDKMGLQRPSVATERSGRFGDEESRRCSTLAISVLVVLVVSGGEEQERMRDCEPKIAIV
jgi:hypothetical protein